MSRASPANQQPTTSQSAIATRPTGQSFLLRWGQLNRSMCIVFILRDADSPPPGQSPASRYRVVLARICSRQRCPEDIRYMAAPAGKPVRSFRHWVSSLRKTKVPSLSWRRAPATIGVFNTGSANSMDGNASTTSADRMVCSKEKHPMKRSERGYDRM